MEHWTTRQLATALNLTPQRITQLEKLGVIPRHGRAGHDPISAVSAFVKFQAQRLTGAPLDAARTAKYQIDTALQTLRYQKEKGELVSRLDVEREWAMKLRQIQGGMSVLPDRVSGPLVGADAAKHHAVLTQEIRQILTVLSGGPDSTNGAHEGPRPAA